MVQETQSLQTGREGSRLPPLAWTSPGCDCTTGQWLSLLSSRQTTGSRDEGHGSWGLSWDVGFCRPWLSLRSFGLSVSWLHCSSNQGSTTAHHHPAWMGPAPGTAGNCKMLASWECWEGNPGKVRGVHHGCLSQHLLCPPLAPIMQLSNCLGGVDLVPSPGVGPD